MRYARESQPPSKQSNTGSYSAILSVTECFQTSSACHRGRSPSCWSPGGASMYSKFARRPLAPTFLGADGRRLPPRSRPVREPSLHLSHASRELCRWRARGRGHGTWPDDATGVDWCDASAVRVNDLQVGDADLQWSGAVRAHVAGSQALWTGVWDGGAEASAIGVSPVGAVRPDNGCSGSRCQGENGWMAAAGGDPSSGGLDWNDGLGWRPRTLECCCRGGLQAAAAAAAEGQRRSF